MADTVEFDNWYRMQTRERLKREKPIVYDKFIQADKKSNKGEITLSTIDLAYSYGCNLTCKHCLAAKFTKKDRKLTPHDLKDLSRQANELGVYKWSIYGGEPLFWPDLEDVVNAVNPNEFLVEIVTNAILLNRDKIAHLKNMGIDKLCISLDYFDASQHDENRNRQGLFKHAIEMMSEAKKTGLMVTINTVVTKQSVRDPQLLRLIEFAKKNGFIVSAFIAIPVGNWEGRFDLLIDPEDAKYLYDLNRQHGVIKRDIYSYMGIKNGCPALKEGINITPYGDVTPCPFLSISVGNIFDEPLRKIIENGMRVKWFKDRSPICLAGEDRNFIKNKLAKTYGKPHPISMYALFTKDEFC